MQAIICPPNARGFDCNATVSADMAHRFRAKEFDFAMRYVRRQGARSSDLSEQEIADLHAAGLAVGAVQHVESEKAWIPSQSKGAAHGTTAAQACTEIGLTLGTGVWMDLEGVAPGTPWHDVDAHCREWWNRVGYAGFTPGLYVGWHCGLSAAQLWALPFEHYWGAFNLNGDERPARRGVQMQQHVAHVGEKPDGCPFDIDTNSVAADLLGGLPILCAPDNWTPKGKAAS